MSVFQTPGFNNKGFPPENVGFPSSRLQKHWLVFENWKFSTLQASKHWLLCPLAQELRVQCRFKALGSSASLVVCSPYSQCGPICQSVNRSNEEIFISIQPAAMRMKNNSCLAGMAHCRWKIFQSSPAWRSANEIDFISGWPGAVRMRNISFLASLAQCKWKRSHFWPDWHSATTKDFMSGQPGALQMKQISFLSSLAQCRCKSFHF